MEESGHYVSTQINRSFRLSFQFSETIFVHFLIHICTLSREFETIRTGYFFPYILKRKTQSIAIMPSDKSFKVILKLETVYSNCIWVSP